MVRSCTITLRIALLVFFSLCASSTTAASQGILDSTDLRGGGVRVRCWCQRGLLVQRGRDPQVEVLARVYQGEGGAAVAAPHGMLSQGRCRQTGAAVQRKQQRTQLVTCR